MTQAWRMVLRKHGGPDAIEREAFDSAPPAPGQLLLRQHAVGLNFIDTYYRSGLYPAPLPLTLGSESVGEVLAVGAGVSGFAVGARVGCINAQGAYATHRLIAADRAIPIPAAISNEVAAAVMLKGLTAWYLAEEAARLSPGQTALVHSAAGGVGSILVPWLRDKGVTVVAHVGSPAKAAGVNADHVLTGSFDALPAQVREATGGRGVDVVYDGVGKDSWAASLASLTRRGLMVSYGNASGAVPPVSLLELMRGGSLYVTRPTLADYTVTHQDLTRGAEALFARVLRGVVPVKIGQRFPLAEAAEAHRALEARRTTGSTVLVP